MCIAPYMTDIKLTKSYSSLKKENILKNHEKNLTLYCPCTHHSVVCVDMQRWCISVGRIQTFKNRQKISRSHARLTQKFEF